MRAYAANGNRAKAVATYHEFRELLAYDVGTGPELETEVLYLRSCIRVGCPLLSHMLKTKRRPELFVPAAFLFS